MTTFGSVSSGIEAASLAFNQLGWRAAWFAEIDPFCNAVLAKRHPHVRNVGDMTKIAQMLHAFGIDAPDVLCGGTPCQAFSTAGLRNSLSDDRGNLSLTFCEIANAIDSTRALWGKPPAVIFWENVPGCLSTSDNFFGCFLAGLAGEDAPLQPAGGKWTDAGCVFGPQRTVAWRTLDAQYFGLAQRRKRVYVVASAREQFDPGKILFESDGSRRDTAPVACEEPEAGSDDTTAERGIGAGVWWDGGQLTQTLDAVLYKKQAMPEKNRFPAVMVPAWEKCECCDDHVCNIHHGLHAHDCDCPSIEVWAEHGIYPYDPCVLRYLTPTECARLQGFPDDYLDIEIRNKPAADGPKYKAIGNSWAVPVVAWIGRRISAQLENL